jgi:CDP-2,3-bis-(O-geranylgeranyl)-sn-glycerol synthase
MDALWLAAKLLVLLAAANTAPLVLKRLLGTRGAWPIDAGLRFVDGRPLLGGSKTWRGLAGAVLATTSAAPVLGLPAWIGAVIGAGAMAGDALSSFVKRRLGVAPSGKATGLDQIPEALLPMLLVSTPLDLSAAQIIGVTLVFFLAEMPMAAWFHRLGLRDRPY